jgi:hypothetical protein
VLAAVTVNVPVVEPAGTVTVAGMVTSFSEAERLTVRFAVGAESSVTVPVVVHPPVTVLGESVSDAIESSTTVTTAFADEYFVVAYRLKE